MPDFPALPEAASFLPPGSSWSVAWWLAAYYLLLMAWAITSTRVTMDARKMFGRSKLWRWLAAALGILVFVVIPITEPRWLLPAGILIAVVPAIYYTTRFYRLGGTGLLGAAIRGTKKLAVLSTVGTIKAVTVIAELVWTVLLALIRFDWNKLSQLPDTLNRVSRRLQGLVSSDTTESLHLVDDAGLPIDPAKDARLAQFPKTTAAQLLDLLDQAARIGATEIQISPQPGGGTEVRYEVDGIVHAGPAVSREDGALVGRAIKAIAGLSPAVFDRPQEGSFPVSLGGQRADITVQTTPNAIGEQISLRNTLQERTLVIQGIAGLGLDDALVTSVRELVARPEGLLLIAGRPDSGKSTTAYAIVNELVPLGRRVVTVEKSVKCQLDNVTQIRAGSRQGLGFPAAIDTALRQDPDVLLVRDILDRETAEAALRAAVSGRLVIACLHADDAADALQRLLAAGIDRGLLCAALAGVIAQRLVRVLCDGCKTPYEPPAELVAKLGLKPTAGMQFQREKGCAKCRSTGYRGRTGVFELLPANEAVQAAFAADATASDTKAKLRGAVARSLRQSAVAKVYRGITSVNEVVRVFK